ncbi:MAG: DNA replication protein DnaD [Ruminococcaceae bacterium]|nr:DNA replication protein DnaD [Oscillospiraceae bacterium]
MNERYTLPHEGGITIQAHAADALLRAKSGDAALIYICMLRHRRGLTPKDAADVLGTSDTDRAKRALDTLRSLGLISYGEEKAPQPEERLPQYTYGDIKRELENGAVFPSLVDEVQRVLNRILSSEELVKLFGIYDSLGLPPEVILQLVNYCVRLCRERYGESRQVYMRFIEKEAYAWERAEIFSIESAEEYIKQREFMRTALGEYQRMLQINGRRMSPSERGYVENWISMGFCADAAELAYDKTVMKTGKLTWKYMDAILRGWHEKGLHTPDEIQGGNRPSGNGQQTQVAENDDYERMKKMLRDIKGE